LVRAEVMQARDDSTKEVLARIDVDAADDPLGELAEVGGEMEEQVGAGGKQEGPRRERSIAIRRRTRRVRGGSPARIEGA
jgi:hypothetical protein